MIVGTLCKTCQAPILYAGHVVTGNAAPIDLEPVLDGNLLVEELTPGGGCVYRVVAQKDRHLHFMKLRRSHYVTCPHAKQHARR